MTASPAKVTVELRAVAGSIEGEVLAPRHAPRRFSGWLELLSALQEAVEDRQRVGARQDGPDTAIGRRAR